MMCVRFYQNFRIAGKIGYRILCANLTLLVLLVMAVILFSPRRAEAFVNKDRISMSKSLAHYAMGQIYDFLGLPNMAVLEYEKAVQFDESCYLIHLRLGVNYARLNLIDDAITELKLVRQYNPDELQSHYLLAFIYSTRRDYDKAAEEYEFILKKFSKAEPENIEVYGYLGQLYYSQKKYNKAIKQFEKILALEPENTDVMYLLGSLYLDVGRDGNAIETLRKSIEIDPEHDGSLNTLGYIYAENNGNLDEAEALIKRALKILPDNGAYLDSLGWVYYQRGKYEKALEVLQKADAVLDDPVIYDHLGDVYYKLNQFEMAFKHWKLSLELLSDQKDVVQKLEDLKNIKVSR